MRLYVAIGLAICTACGLAVVGQESPANPKAKVELFWLEGHQVAGLTEEVGISGCDPKSILYPHKKSTLLLTAANTSDARFSKYTWVANGSSTDHYNVTIQLTKEARDALAAACGDKKSAWLTMKVDGKYCGSYDCYVKDKERKFVADQIRAESFTPTATYSTEADAKRLVDAFN